MTPVQRSILHPKERSTSISSLQRSVFIPRLAIAVFLLPCVYLIVPSIIIFILSTISSFSKGHEFLAIFLCIALTNAVYYQIHTHAPSVKYRDDAFRKCGLKLPCGCLLLSMLVCHLAGPSSEKHGSFWWGVSATKWWGVRLWALGFALSCITMTRFIGPFKIVKCSNFISYKNPREVSVSESVWMAIDHFLYHLSLPPSTQKFQHATFKEVAYHIFVIVGILGFLLGRLYSWLVFDSRHKVLCVISSVVTICYLFLHLVTSKNFDLDISSFPNVQQDSKWKLWFWEEGVSNVLRVMNQMIPFFIVLGLSGILFGFFSTFLQVFCFLIAPTACHIVFTDLLVRLVLSQHVNLKYFSPQVILELLLMDATDVAHIITKSNNPIYPPMEEENNIYFQSVSTMANVLSSGIPATNSPLVLDNVLRLVFLKSLQNQSSKMPISDATKDGSIELVYILRYLCIYLGSLGTALNQFHKKNSSQPIDSKSKYLQGLNIPCLSTCCLAYINYSVTILHSVLRNKSRHARMSILLPVFLQSLFDLHKGLLEHTRHVDERKNIVTLNTIEDIVMDFTNELHDALKMQPEVKLWIDDIRIRNAKKNV